MSSPAPSPAPSHRTRCSSASLWMVVATSVLLVLAGAALLLGRGAVPPSTTGVAPQVEGQLEPPVEGQLEGGLEGRVEPVADLDDVRARRDVVRAARVLRAWDGARGAAYAAGDGRALGRLYVPGSEAGRADRRILQAYAARGLVVRGMRMQVLDLEVLDRTPEGMRLLVTDRLHRAVAVTKDGERTRLPCDLPSTRVLTLVRASEARGRVPVVEEAEARGRVPVVEEAEARGRLETTWRVSAVRLRSGP